MPQHITAHIQAIVNTLNLIGAPKGSALEISAIESIRKLTNKGVAA